MKTILILILSCLPLFAATTYPVLTDNANRTFTGGATNMALLSGTNVFTGTNTFTAANFFPANNIGMRLLYSLPTNLYISTLSTAANKTNKGDFNQLTSIINVTLPALLGSNSELRVSCFLMKTNANTTAANLAWFVGPNTNFLGLQSSAFNTSAGATTFGIQNTYFVNANSFTNQLQGASFGAPTIYAPTNFVDTSVPFNLSIGASTVTSFTNVWLYNFKIYELYAP